MVPQQAIDLIAEFEGFRSEAYKCPSGVWTVGYGTTNAVRLMKIGPGAVVTEPQARELLRRTLEKFVDGLRPLLTREPSSEQWAAMLSLAYNIGPGAFARSSVLRWFNRGDYERAADAFLLWNKAGGKVLKGLVRRREAERRLFLEPSGIRVN